MNCSIIISQVRLARHLVWVFFFLEGLSARWSSSSVAVASSSLSAALFLPSAFVDDEAAVPSAMVALPLLEPCTFRAVLKRNAGGGRKERRHDTGVEGVHHFSLFPLFSRRLWKDRGASKHKAFVR